MLMAWVIFVFI